MINRINMYDSIKNRLLEELKEINRNGRFKSERIIKSAQGSKVKIEKNRTVLNFCSNNYLGLASNNLVIRKASDVLKSHGYGLSSVRFICGTQDIHKELEKRISKFLGKEDTILYAAAFDANGGLFEPLFSQEQKQRSSGFVFPSCSRWVFPRQMQGFFFCVDIYVMYVLDN